MRGQALARRYSTRWSLWGAPLVIGVASAIGLTVALFDDDWLDVLATVLLGVPVVLGWLILKNYAADAG